MGIEEHVLGFDVSVADFEFVEVDEGCKDLREVMEGFGLNLAK